jgi:phosphatidylglycerol:prolipoprotein diacylglycerol transferase
MRIRPHPNGTLFWWYLVLAPAARFMVEFIRINPRVAFGLTEAQVISLILVAIGTWRLLAARGFSIHPAASLSTSKQ